MANSTASIAKAAKRRKILELQRQHQGSKMAADLQARLSQYGYEVRQHPDIPLAWEVWKGRQLLGGFCFDEVWYRLSVPLPDNNSRMPRGAQFVAEKVNCVLHSLRGGC